MSLEPGDCFEVKFERGVLSYYYSGVYWYCREIKIKTIKGTGCGETQLDALNDFIEVNKL